MAINGKRLMKINTVDVKQKYIAIVAGTGSYNDLGVIRSLGEKRIPVYYVTDKEHVFPIHKSKYIVQTIYCIMSEKALVDAIKTLCAQQRAYGVVFPTSDITALYLDRNYEDLKDICFSSHAHGRLEEEMDKLQMVNRAVEAGLNVPSSQAADARELPESIKFPCIIKPLASAFGEKSDIAVCHNSDDLSSAVKVYVEKGNVHILIQDLVTDVRHEIAVPGLSLPNGEVIIKGVVIKRCVMGNGSTVYGEYFIDEHSALYEKIKKYIQSVGYVGIFDMEFLLDNSDEYHFIECNYRNGAYGYAVTFAGFNMPFLFFQAITSQPWNKPKRLQSVVFMEERSYILNLTQKRMTVWHWFKDVLSTDVFLWLNRRDLRPYIRVPHFVKKLFTKGS